MTALSSFVSPHVFSHFPAHSLFFSFLLVPTQCFPGVLSKCVSASSYIVTTIWSFCCCCFSAEERQTAQNLTIEERVTILEAEMTEVFSDVGAVMDDVDFLFDEQFLQDQRLLNLEIETNDLDDEILRLDDTIEGCEEHITMYSFGIYFIEWMNKQLSSCFTVLQIRTLSLENRVLILEENGGGSHDNSSIVDLEIRVTDLEIENADQAENIATNTHNLAGAWFCLCLWLSQCDDVGAHGKPFFLSIHVLQSYRYKSLVLRQMLLTKLEKFLMWKSELLTLK